MLHKNAPIPMKQPPRRVRFRVRLIQWLTSWCLSHEDRQRLYSWLSRVLNIEKDGKLDLGRPREGNLEDA